MCEEKVVYKNIKMGIAKYQSSVDLEAQVVNIQMLES